MNAIRFLTVLIVSVVCMSWSALPAFADPDVGNVAIIEDVNGNILPAEGMCDNMLFAQGLCVNHAATAFYQSHGDNYDILVFFTPKAMNPLFNVQMGFPVQVAAAGIGLESFSLFNPAQFGSAGRLRQCVKMGSLPALTDNPTDLGVLPPITGVELMAHEIGHQWLCWITVDHDDGQGLIPVLRGWEDGPNGHWSCMFNNHGSVMYGGSLTDNGDGTFTDTGVKRKYSQLDQYLMGLRAADEVDDMWYVSDGTTEGCPSMPMRPGAEWVHEGTRVDFPIEDIIRANGPRVPELENCHLKAGFAIVYESGFPPTEFDIAKVDIYRTELQKWWPGGTDNRGSLDTRLDGCGTGTATCQGEPSPQCGAGVDGDWDMPADGDESCIFNEFRCSPKGSVEICSPVGEWEWIQDCVRSQVCRDGACVDDGDGDEGAADGDRVSPDGDKVSPDGDDPADGEQPDGDDLISPDGDVPTATDGDTSGVVGGEGAGGGCAQATRSLPGLLLMALAFIMMVSARRRKTQ